MGLKIPGPNGRAGSSPAAGTTNLVDDQITDTAFDYSVSVIAVG